MDCKKIEEGVRLILEGVGEDPRREGLDETPARVARMYDEILSGIDKDPKVYLQKVYHTKHDEMVMVKNIPLYSMCEHHMLPFLGKAHVAYIPRDGVIVGLSKLIRVLQTLSRRLQIQERLTSQFADMIMEGLNPLGVLVVVEAEHLCMSMRGVSEAGAVATTSAVRGAFQSREKTRLEAMELLRK
ncbi:MAG: GTP cyclohydrolase I FolE [Candidatus Coatesbacteria bacterium]|nr:GTP cyclohydrolase I FolE [Candidatus Coatesbacteria bacterium]